MALRVTTVAKTISKKDYLFDEIKPLCYPVSQFSGLLAKCAKLSIQEKPDNG